MELQKFEIDGTGVLKNYCGSGSTVVIPHTVREIGPRAFFGHSEITALAIPEGVTEIGAAAFFECTGLTEIVLPDSVERVRKSAFSKCKGLRRVVLGRSLRLLNDTGLEYRLLNVTLPGDLQDDTEPKHRGDFDLRIRASSVLKCLSPALKQTVITGFLRRYASREASEEEIKVFLGYLRLQRKRLIREIPSLPLCVFLTENRFLRPDEVDTWLSDTDAIEIKALLLNYKNSTVPSDKGKNNRKTGRFL